jgi:endonuclease/exonuclease/phosphatase family metal-dependent hydrolase
VLGIHHGTAVLSRGAMQPRESLAFQTSFLDDKGYVRATVAPASLGGRAIDVVSVHLDPFTGGARRRQIDAMARWLARRERPVVVMGDMNAAWGRETGGDVARLASVLGLCAWEPRGGGRGALGTYPAGRPWRRIDWILVSPELSFASYAVVPARVSDHRGVVADVVFR